MSFYSDTPVIFGGVSGVTATPGAKDPELGARTTYNGNHYLYAYNGADTQAVPGMALVPLSGSNGYTGTVTAVASYDIPLGVVYNTTMTTNTYGWVLTRGYGVAYTSAAIAAKIPLEITASGIFGTAVTGTVWGVLTSATSAATNLTGGAYFSL